MKISICLCTYNAEKYINKLLPSILSQTLTPDIILINDDCSSDSTIKILDSYASSYPKIKWIIKRNKENLGWRKNYQNAISHCPGDLIFLCDQDDIWNKEKIYDMAHSFNFATMDVLCSGYKVSYDNSKAEKVHNKRFFSGKIKQIKSPHLLADNYPGCCLCFSSKIIPLFISSLNENAPHDWILWNLAFLRKRLYMLDKPEILFIRHFSSASNSGIKPCSKEKFEIKFNELKYKIDFLSHLISLEDKDHVSTIERKYLLWLKNRYDFYSQKKLSSLIKVLLHPFFFTSFRSLICEILGLFVIKKK